MEPDSLKDWIISLMMYFFLEINLFIRWRELVARAATAIKTHSSDFGKLF
jgi:hypothetical protein